MNRPSATPAGVFVLILFLSSGHAFSQAPASERGVDFSGMQTVTRIVDKTYPVGDAPEVFVSNKFGAIRVTAWGNNLVRLTARIEVGAESQDRAARFAQAIEVSGNHVEDRVEVRTLYPQPGSSERIGYAVDLELNVPLNTVLNLENTFGNIHVRGVAGAVTLDSRYGVIELHDLDAPVRVRAKGQFPLVADRLRGGGSFFLRSTQASFSSVSNALHVDNYLGSVDIRAPGDRVDMDVSSESGPIHLYLPPGADPHIEAAADFGGIESELVLNGETWGESSSGSRMRPESKRRFDLYASFDSIYIHRAGEGTAETVPDESGIPFQDQFEARYELEPGATILVDATVGDVEVVGDGEDSVFVTAKQFVRVTDESNARMALEGLGVRVTESTGRLEISTVLQDDLEALGCTEYRVDLVLHCPSWADVEVIAQRGHTSLGQTTGRLTVEQGEGLVTFENTGGVVDASNRNGGIEIAGATGPVTLKAADGPVLVRDTRGSVEIACDRGRTVIEAPGGPVTVRNTGGDVRIIALDGVNGDFDVSADHGNISMALPPSSDAWLMLNAYGGTIRSSVPVSGTTERDMQTFQGRLNGATHRVLLETHEGNIVID